MYIILKSDYTVVSCHDEIVIDTEHPFVVHIRPDGERPTVDAPVIHLLLDPKKRFMAAYWDVGDCLARCVDGLTCETYFVN